MMGASESVIETGPNFTKLLRIWSAMIVALKIAMPVMRRVLSVLLELFIFNLLLSLHLSWMRRCCRLGAKSLSAFINKYYNTIAALSIILQLNDLR